MKLAILDRIGTLHRQGDETMVAATDWQPQPGVLEAIAQLNRAGWQVALATNQPGLGRGSFDVNDLNALHARMQRALAAAGARIDAAFFCPHTPEEACSCRKPAPGLLQQLASRYGAEPHEVWVIGQDPAHLQAGDAMGAHVLAVADTAGGVPVLGTRTVVAYDTWQDMAQALAPDVQAPPAPPS